jgi:hypothetical protein
MAGVRVASGHRIIDPMLALGDCTKQHRILMAGSNSIAMMIELQRRGYARTASSGNCGRPAGQYDIALIDWRGRTLHDLETTLDWLRKFLSPAGVLVVWVDAQKPAANQSLRMLLETRRYVIQQDSIHECGRALVARRLQPNPLKKAA